MAGNREKSRLRSRKIAFCAMIVALSTTLMLSGGLIPIATYCAPMFCALFLLPILMEYGKKTAWTAFAATAIITLLLDIDKEAAFFYVFIGHYPLLKWELERIKSKPVRLILKLAVFNLSIFLMYLFLGLVLNMHAVIAEFTQMGAVMLIAFIIALNLCLLLYDRLIFPMMILYDRKLRPRFRSLPK